MFHRHSAQSAESAQSVPAHLQSHCGYRGSSDSWLARITNVRVYEGDWEGVRGSARECAGFIFARGTQG